MGTDTRLPRPFIAVGLVTFTTGIAAALAQDWILARWWAMALLLLWCLILVSATMATSSPGRPPANDPLEAVLVYLDSCRDGYLDLADRFTCDEAAAYCALLIAVGRPADAAAFMREHSLGDFPGDEHYQDQDA